MPELRPFRGLRYADADHLRDLVCPPYDVISAAEQHHLHELNPANAVHLELSRAHDERGERNLKVAETFHRWIAEGVLVRDERDALYVYRQDYLDEQGARRRVVGVIGALRLEPFGGGSGILPHERTMPGPIEERLALMHALPVNISPIYAIYRGGGELTPYLEALENRPCLARFADGRGTRHSLWMVNAPAELAMLSDAFAPGPLVIADGHHRYETALAYANDQTEPGEHDAVMCFVVDADVEDLVVLPYHRALKTSVTSDELRRRLAAGFDSIDVTGRGEEALAASKSDAPFLWRWRDGSELLVEVSDGDVVARVGERPAAWRDLHVVALHEAVLPAVLPEGVEDLGFSKDPQEISRLLAHEGYTAGVLLQALDPTQVVEVARSGERMPQKASYFWPKALTGLVFRTLS